MGPYETAIEKITEILEDYDFSGITREQILNESINDLIAAVIELYSGLKDINNIINKIGGV